MTGYLQSDVSNIIRYLAEIDIAVKDGPPPIVQKKLDYIDSEIVKLADQVKSCRQYQKNFLAVLQLAAAIDYTIPKGCEQTRLEILALKILSAATGSQKIKCVKDGEIIRVNRIDVHEFQGDPEHRRGYYFFSPLPVPGVYFLPQDGIAVSLDPVYVPLTTTEAK